MSSIRNAIASARTATRKATRHTSWRSTAGAASTAAIVLFGFFYERIFKDPLPADVRDALVLLFATAVTWWGASTRDNRVSSEDVGIKGRVVGEIVEGSAIKLAEPVEVVEPEPQTTPDPAVAAKPTEPA
jgi:hypothetical protein